MFESRYRLLQDLAEGGSSVGRKAFDNQTEDTVWIKFIEPNFDELVTLELFDQEVETLQALRHQPSGRIVRIIDSGYSSTHGKNYICLEYLSETLWSRLKRVGKIDKVHLWDELAGSIIEAVDFAHDQNICHRDINPNNIMFRTSSPEDYQAVVIDYGISKNASASGSSQTLLGKFYTPFFSPEDLSKFTDFERDLFGIGMVLLQVLFDKRIDSRSSLSRALSDLESVPFLNEAKRTLIRKSLSDNANERFTSISDLKIAHESSFHLAQNIAPEPAIQIPLYFSGKAFDYLQKSRNSRGEIGYVKEKLSYGEVYARFKQDTTGHLDTSRFFLSVGEVRLTCALPEDLSTGSVAVITAREYESFESAEYENERSLYLKGKFRFVISDKNVVFRKNKGLSTLRTSLVADFHSNEGTSRGASKEIAQLGSRDRLSIWSRTLDAREHYILNRYPRLSFFGGAARNKRFSLSVNGKVEKIEAESCWEIEGTRGSSLYFSDVNNGRLTFYSPKPLGLSIPKKGVLKPSLGFTRPSIQRQRDALSKVVLGTAAISNLKAIIDAPDNLNHSLRQGKIVRFFDENLDADKKSSVERAIASDSLFLVEGPPGTGKTSFIVETIKQFFVNSPNGRVLLDSPTHVAVDNALERLEASGFESMLRIASQNGEKAGKNTRHLLVAERYGQWVEQCIQYGKNYIVRLAESAGIPERDLEIANLTIEFLELAAVKEGQGKSDVSFTLHELQLQAEAEVESSNSENELFDKKSRSGEIRKRLAQLGLTPERSSKLSVSEAQKILHEMNANFSEFARIRELALLQRIWSQKIRFDLDLRTRFVKNTKVLAGTCTGFLGMPEANDLHFDLCIIDEASKATSTEALVPMVKSSKVILVGDDHQLPPSEEDLLRSQDTLKKFDLSEEFLLETLFSHMFAKLPNTARSSLLNQYRMQPTIGSMISECFYGGRLRNATDAQFDSRLICDKPLRWVSTSGLEDRKELRLKNTSIMNASEVVLVAEEVKKLNARIASLEMPTKPSLLVITPYTGQKAALQEELTKIHDWHLEARVETFDAVQGVESDFSIISMVRSNNENEMGFVGPKYWRRLNVALSRSRYQLVIVGDDNFCRLGNKHIGTVLKYFSRHLNSAEIVSAPDAQ